MFTDRIISHALAAGLLLGGSLAQAQDQVNGDGKDQRHHQQPGQTMQGPHGAGHGSGHGSGMMGMMHGTMRPLVGDPHPNMAEDIDLTEEQTTQLADLHATLAREHFVLMREMREPRKRLHELMSAEQLDIGAIGQAYDELAELRKAMLLNRLEAKKNMNEILENGS